MTATLDSTLAPGPTRPPREHASPSKDRRNLLASPFAAVLGSLSLGGIVAGSLFVVLAAAERRSFLSPPSRAGFPHWMSGPLAGLLPGLTHHLHELKLECTLAVAGMFLLYLIVLVCIRKSKIGEHFVGYPVALLESDAFRSRSIANLLRHSGP